MKCGTTLFIHLCLPCFLKIVDTMDNCQRIPNPDQMDSDGDGVGDVCDNCPIDRNSNQNDLDGDFIGNRCDDDDDDDGVLDSSDNCGHIVNSNQTDVDGDGIGDACDNCMFQRNTDQCDIDHDGVGDACDNCPPRHNPRQENADHDESGDACDIDDDNDGIVDSSDNCIIIANANQRNSDSDTFGNECDNCPYIGNQNQRDSDEDGVGDVCDNCLLTPNPDQENDDDDQQGDACDNDYDNDGFVDGDDNCPLTNNPDQADSDNDTVGDDCDNCIFTNNTGQENSDGDSAGIACDADDDNDTLVAEVGFEKTVYRIAENVGAVEVCVNVERPMINCPISLPFTLDIRTTPVIPGTMPQSELLGFNVCQRVKCLNLTIHDDSTLDLTESLNLTLVMILPLKGVRLNPATAAAEIMIMDDDLSSVFVDFDSFITVSENSAPRVCATVNMSTSDCPVGFPFELVLSTSNGTAVLGEDFTTISMLVMFAPCQNKACVFLSIKNDNISEGIESFHVRLERTPMLDNRITLSTVEGEIYITDDDAMVIGFNSTSYIAIETDQQVTVCIDVLNPPSGGALRPFTVALLPDKGFETSNSQYILECNRKLNFSLGDSTQCYSYRIIDDLECELHDNMSHFAVRVTLITTDDTELQIESDFSVATVTIDDSTEPECFVWVGYQKSTYTISEVDEVIDICVTSMSPGIEAEFVINVTTTENNTNSTIILIFTQSISSLDFVVNSANLSDTQCYNISVDFDVEDICDRSSDCSDIVLLSHLTKTNKNDYVSLIEGRDTTEVRVKLPERCTMSCLTPSSPTDSSSSTGLLVIIMIVIAIILSLSIVVAIVVILAVYRKRKLKKYNISLHKDDINEHHYFSLEEKQRVTLLQQLQKQLQNKKMIYSKDQLQLSNTVGQGESGLVYKAYLNTAVGKELVAVKTGKALFSASDMERLAKEVSTMLSFEHVNVMPLLGVCIDGEMPLLIMPFMTNGSVLEYVKRRKEELLLCGSSAKRKIQAASKTLLGTCHQITKGMEYLALQKFVHRDLAARNCMINQEGVIKVADFGLTEDMYGTNYFRRRKSTASEEKVPIRWMAPESIKSNLYDESTDVWAFGVTAWEIFTCGRIPYAGIPAMNLLKALQRGERLEKPDNEICQDEIYEIMMSCWHFDSHKRPKFQRLVSVFGNILEREFGYLELSLSDGK